MTGADSISQEAISTAEADRPVVPRERNLTLDFIRGVAVLGILFCNITAFGQPYTAYYWPPAINGGATSGDGLVWLFQFVFLDGKFRALFTMLFGAGIYLFLERAWARGQGRKLQARRLTILLGFGLVHYFLIWRGDILALYASWGLVALLFTGWSINAQRRFGLIAVLGGSVLLALLMAGQFASATMPAAQQQLTPEQLESIVEAPQKSLDAAQAEVVLYSGDSYPAIVHFVVTEKVGQLVAELVFAGLFETLGLIMLGMALYRMGLFAAAIDRAVLLRRGWIAVIGGCAVSLALGLWPLSEGFPFYTTQLVFNGLGAPPHIVTALGLLALLVAWAPAASATALGTRFVAAGRMAFSNYLGTSIVMMPLFQGWGLGLFGKLHRLELIGVVLTVWLVMLVWSPWWLARFRYGPLEWIWRCLTYGKLLPLRR